MTKTMLHAKPAHLTDVAYANYVERTVIRDNGAFISVDVTETLAGESTRHFGGFDKCKVDAHAAALKWIQRITFQKP